MIKEIKIGEFIMSKDGSLYVISESDGVGLCRISRAKMLLEEGWKMINKNDK